MKMTSKNRTPPLISIGVILLILFLLQVAKAQTVFKVPKYPYETVIADYDQDGDNDIIVGCNGPNQDPDSIVIFFNDGWGNFETEKFAAKGGGFLYCEDLTNDGYPDILTRDGYSIFFYENDQSNGIGTEHFVRDTDGNPFIGGIADIDLDSYLDIVNYNITIPFGWGVSFNNGDNSFTDSIFIKNSDSWYRPNVGDLNNDNMVDILVTTFIPTDSIHILYNNYPDFYRYNLDPPKWGEGFIANINDDNLKDITLVRPLYIGPTWIINRINKGSYFQHCDTLVFVNGTSIDDINDFNNDGYDDFAMTVYQANNLPIEDSVYIYFNDQQCGITHAQSIYVGDYFNLATISSGDLNGNGYPDLVIRGYNMPTPDHIRILWNDGTGHFIDTSSVYVCQPEIQILNSVEIYPNPSTGNITISSASKKICSLSLFDLRGVQLLQVALSSPQNKISLNIDNTGIKSGTYICKVILENDNTIFKKIIINKHY